MDKGIHKNRIGFCPECRRNAIARRNHGHKIKWVCQVCGCELEPLSPDRERWMMRMYEWEQLELHRGSRHDKPKKWQDDWDELDEAIKMRPSDFTE